MDQRVKVRWRERERRAKAVARRAARWRMKRAGWKFWESFVASAARLTDGIF